MINELPPEMLGEILAYLNLSELVEKKLVSKLWNELISSNLKIGRLVVDSYRNQQKDRWFHANRPVNRYLGPCHPNLFVAQFDRPILSNLRYLRIDEIDENSEIRLGDLNRFTLLEHLKIDVFISDRTPDRIEWSLPNLRTLKVIFCQTPTSEKEIQASIDAPKLDTVYWTRKLKLKSPETIRTLDASLYGSELSSFRNVEVYRCAAKFQFINDALNQGP